MLTMGLRIVAASAMYMTHPFVAPPPSITLLLTLRHYKSLRKPLSYVGLRQTGRGLLLVSTSASLAECSVAPVDEQRCLCRRLDGKYCCQRRGVLGRWVMSYTPITSLMTDDGCRDLVVRYSSLTWHGLVRYKPASLVSLHVAATVPSHVTLPFASGALMKTNS